MRACLRRAARAGERPGSWWSAERLKMRMKDEKDAREGRRGASLPVRKRRQCAGSRGRAR